MIANIGGGLSMVVCVLPSVSIGLLITLLSIQGSWNGGGTCCIARERSVGIALLVFVMITFACSVISFAFMVAAYADVRDGYPDHYELYDVTVESSSMGLAVFLCLSAMICALVTAVLVAVPCAFGIEYAPRGSSCFGDNSKYDRAREKVKLHSRTTDNCTQMA